MARLGTHLLGIVTLADLARQAAERPGAAAGDADGWRGLGAAFAAIVAPRDSSAGRSDQYA